MPRMRTLKPDFWSDKRMVKLSAYARLFYMGMWTFSICHNGHLDDDAEELKLKILPVDQIDPCQLLDELIGAGRVKRCTNPDGTTYLWIPKLAEHQNIDPRWKPRCPYCAQKTTPNHVEPPPTTHEPARVTPSHPPGRDGKGRDKNTSSPTAPVTEDDPDFVQFWAAYPRRVGKGHARKAWAKAIAGGAGADAVTAAAEAFAAQCARNRTEARFIPHPTTWLNGERWSDQNLGSGRAPAGPLVPFWDA